MRFELSEALIDDILFSMEDQEGEFMMDTVEGVVAGGIGDQGFSNDELDDDDGTRYISLPEWDSASGFRLMERFAAGLRNPMVREELSSALGQGKGVFRAFKNTLARYPETEKLWFVYKEKEMRREIIRWYNGLREEWGLEKIGIEPEDTEDLVLEDFCFRPFQKEDFTQAEELHRLCIEEFKSTLARTGLSTDAIANEVHVLRNIPGSSFEIAMTAEFGESQFAGYISGTKKDTVLFIQNLEVKAEFRGLGIGEALLTRLLESLDPEEIDQVLLDLPSCTEGFSRVLHRESFKPYSVRYWLKLRDRAD
ncbi:MAG: GNAT family N-acetyltransferase [Treponema sp.]|jgi:ribosomal protein S18 acetylase RimI-like enzyme|nr:GNAT family N-acetyltransferase [Treponema sp.]